MTLLTARDGDSTEFDYIDLAEALTEHGDVTVKRDLAQLWRRIAFSVAIHNTDDHLRNHGFLRGKAGWALSPLFAVNPNPDTAKEREIGIGAAHAQGEVLDATADWREVATGNGIPERELGRMSDAFDGLRAHGF